jgi:hypothetical protein
MRFRKTALKEITNRISSLGAGVCLVCRSEEQHVWPEPILLPTGGLTLDPSKPKDPEENVLFMVRVGCLTCGHTLLFNSETMVGHKERILVQGMTEAEEEEAENNGRPGGH